MAHTTPPIVKATGVTASERVLAQLCEHTFLSLWSYPAVYRDQRAGKKTEGKEVCDVLVVFGNHVIIFSDKHCAFPATGDVTVDWARWFKRAISSAADQLWGAERWIRQHPERIFLDRASTQPFPVPLPSPESARYHLVAIANGSAQRTQDEFGGRGGLVLELSVTHDAHLGKPFTIGDLDPKKTFVHVFDEIALPIVLTTLDTIADFVRYLEKKAEFVRSSVELISRSEQDLLALYLRNESGSGEREFVPTEDAGYVIVDTGFWDDFESSPERQAQLKWAEISYLWDAMIDDFAHHTLTGTHEFAISGSFSTSDQLLRFLAREPRARRRMLASAFRDALHRSTRTERRIQYLVPQRPGEPYYVFLFFPKPQNATREQYRQMRLKFLGACCLVTKLEHPEAHDIVGIAMEAGLEPGERSEDAAYFDARAWSEEDAAHARGLQQQLEIHLDPIVWRMTADQPPLAPLTVPPIVVQAQKGSSRNYPCPCGSGDKYKRCHGKS